MAIQTGQNIVPADFSLSALAGEALTAGDAVMVSDGNEFSLLNAQSTTNTINRTTTGTIWNYQTFLTSANTNKIQRIALYFDAIAGNVGSMTVSIRATAGGADLFTAIVGGDANSTGERTFDMPIGGWAVSPNTTYFLIIRTISRDGFSVGIAGGTVSSYANGVSGRSLDSGVTWSTPDATITGDIYFKIFETTNIAGRIYKTSANSAVSLSSLQSWTKNFLGFVQATVVSGVTASVQLTGQFIGLTGLTIGRDYFLSNTAGAIGLTAGTVSKKIGIALSATSILIKSDN